MSKTNDISYFFNPKTIAVIGASSKQGKVGYNVLRNIVESKYKGKIFPINPKDLVLEIGTGCGLIALEASRRGASVICTDKNPFSVQLTRNNILKNKHLLKGSIEVRKGDLFKVIRKDELFDIIIFNPPYLPTSVKDKVNRWFDMATNGGKDGLAITKSFLKDVNKHLSFKGRAYFVFSSLADRLKLEEFIKKLKLRYKVILSHRFNDESLEIYCVY